MISNFFSWLSFLFRRRIVESGYVTSTSTPISTPAPAMVLTATPLDRSLYCSWMRYHSFRQPLWLMRKSKQTTRPAKKRKNERRETMR